MSRRLFRFATLLLLVVGFFQFALPAQAQYFFPFVPQVTTTAADVPRTIFQAIDKAYQAVKAKIKVATDIAFKNGAQTFLATATQQFALSLATTAPGQKPLFMTKPLTFFRDVQEAATSDFLDDFTRGLTGASFNQRGQLVGGTTGPSNTDQQTRFIISRLLRAGSDATGALCRDDCQTNFGVSESTTSSLGSRALQLTSLVNVPGNNDHDKAVLVLTSVINSGIGTAAKDDPTKPTFCPFVSPAAGDNAPWIFSIGVCQANSAAASCTIPARDCYNHLVEALNVEHSEATQQVNQCLRECSTGVGGVARSAITRATSRDVFAAVENFDIRQSPAAIASRLSSSDSDFGKLLSASALLTATVQQKILGEETRLTAGTLPRTSKVSEEVLTPKEATSALFGIPFYNQDGQLTYTGTGAADILKGVASFINSPVGKALTTYFRSRCGLNPDACKGPQNTQSEIGRILFGSGGQTGVAGAQLQFASLGQIDILSGDPGKNQVDVLSQLTSAGLVDPKFAQAVEEKLTVQQALDRGLLQGQRTVGFDNNGLEPQDGYTYRSLQYLRKNRIIPVGWELATQYAKRFSSSNLTLNTLTKQFNMCGQDDQSKVCSKSLVLCSSTADCQTGGVDGGTCGASPYCGLVDPDWVLKAPQTYCRRQGAGEDIITKEFVCDQNNVRNTDGSLIPDGQSDTVDVGAPNCVENSLTNQYPDVGRWVIARDTNICADTQSCVAESDDGTCLAYGYCVQEKETFVFQGTQCDAHNATCTTYTNPAGQKVSYLGNSVDFASCEPGSAGCQWYCQKPSYNTDTKQWTCSETAGSKIYFTAQVQECSAGDVGCRQFIKIAPGANLLANSGFEQFEGGAINSAPALFTGWSSGLISMVPVSADDANTTVNNQVAVRVTAPGASDTISQVVQLGAPLQERVFTATVRARADTACTATLEVCAGGACNGSPLKPSQEVNVATSWGTGAVQISVPTLAEISITDTRLTVQLRPGSGTGSCANVGLTIDSMQLEEVAGLSPYKDYGQSNLVALNGQRTACTVADVGCEAYTPKSGGAVVNALAQPSDRCSADSVGCQLFHREPIKQLPYRDYSPATPTSGGADVTIVAPKGDLCSAADVGCEEYTNLDTVAQGGEGKEYYSTVKQCALPTNTSVTKGTFYTWVGDPQRGLSLHSSTLVTSNISAGPCTNLGVGTTTSNPTCQDTGASVAAATCSLADLATNSDCTQYYDANLNIYYLLKSKTVTVTADCHPYRNTIDQTDGQYAANKDNVYYLSRGENRTCRAAAASCRAFTGNTGAVRRTVVTDMFERAQLTNWTGGDISSASTQVGGRSMIITPNGASGVAFTQTSVLKDKLAKGRTYVLTFTGAAASATGTPRIRAFFGTGNDSSGVFSTDRGVAFQTGEGVAARWDTTITPSGPSWQAYTLGPVTLIEDPAIDFRLGLIADGGAVYVDNIKLVEIQDVTYQINNSAPSCQATEVGCKAYTNRANATVNLKSFSRLCNKEVVGCTAMIDTQNSSSPFEQTVKGVTTPADQVVTVVDDPSVYCRDTAKGCEAYGKPTYIRDETLSGFTSVNLINNPDRHQDDLCLANQQSCQAFTQGDGTTVYFKDPRTSTCSFVTDRTGSGTWYITGTTIPCATTAPASIQPVGASCSPVCQGGSRAGKACGVPSTNATVNAAQCPGGGTCVGNLATAGRISVSGGGTVVGQCTSSTQCTGGNGCVYQVGLCPEQQNSCTLYRNPSQPTSCQTNCSLTLQGGSPVYVDASCTKTVCRSQSGTPGAFEGQNCQNSQQCGAGSICAGASTSTPTTGAPGCQAYTYLKNTLEDTAGECNGVVDPKQGCLPFNDTSNPTLNFRGQ